MFGPLRRYGAVCVALAGLGAYPALAQSDKQDKAATEQPAEQRGKRLQTVPRVSAKTPPASWVAAEPQTRACFKSRRKLWQDGEGWMVKSVTVCP